MSRIGKKSVTLPKGVTVAVDGNEIEVKGPKGSLRRSLPALVSVNLGEGVLMVNRTGEDRRARAFHGLARSLIQNMVTGVSDGFTRVMVIEGVGYRAESEGNRITFNVGYSNPVAFDLPKGISVELADRGAKLTLTGIDKELIGQVCAKIRAIRPPEPYKGKGIRFINERVRRKVGKAGVA